MNTNTYNRCNSTENPKVIITVLKSAKTKSKTKHTKTIKEYNKYPNEQHQPDQQLK